MDSGNSGSLQSSSGGDDQEYDSSPFPSFHFNPHPSLVSSHQPTNFPSTDPHLLNPAFSLSQPDPIQPPTLRSDPPPSAPAPAPKNPRKRTRASRRAPTTVLTTDTSNFRQMVQEFTGIPAAPFSAGSSSFSSRRLDLFATAGSSMRATPAHLEPSLAPLYPLRPSPLKPQPAALFANSSSPSNPTLLLNNNSAISQSLLNMQSPNPLLSFQASLLPFNLPGFDPKSPPQPTIPSLEELGLAASTMRSRGDSAWRGDGESEHGFRSTINYGGSSQRVTGNSCKLNYSAAAAGVSSEFLQHDKGLENVGSRGEGTVESWICPSD